jgi:gamma-glutamylcyclotransferase (GGCT)/AIG2-like uncharacterized protein YtfP
MPSRLFAYGTLRQGVAPAEIAHAVARLRRVGTGVTPGRQFDLGEYPGSWFAAPGAAAAAPMEWGEIAGEVYDVRDPEIWAQLDRYEGFEASDPAASLFIRRQIEVTLHDGGVPVICWAYEYNRPVEFALQPAAENASPQKT